VGLDLVLWFYPGLGMYVAFTCFGVLEFREKRKGIDKLLTLFLLQNLEN